MLTTMLIRMVSLAALGALPEIIYILSLALLVQYNTEAILLPAKTNDDLCLLLPTCQERLFIIYYDDTIIITSKTRLCIYVFDDALAIAHVKQVSNYSVT